MMHVVRPPAPPKARPPAPSAVRPSQPRLQRTSPNPGKKEKNTIKPSAEKKSKEKPAKVKPIKADRTANKEKVAAAQLDEKTLEQLRAELEQREAEQRKRKSQLMQEVAAITAQAPGAKRPYVSDGAEQGTIREINIARYPKSMQERFFKRFHIKIQIKYLSGGSHSGFVNAVITDRGTYESHGGSGYYEVMTISPQLNRRMAQLELQELQRRHLDPLRTRVIEIVFGLREDEDGRVDLCVTRFKAEPIK